MKRKLRNGFLVLLVVLVAACPYVGLYFLLRLVLESESTFLLLLFFSYWPVWLTGLLCALIVLFTQRLWASRTLALATMVVKLVQIPSGGVWSLLVLISLLCGTDPQAPQLGLTLALFFGAPAIILSGILGLAAVMRSRKVGALTNRQAVGYGVLQFIFCADIVGSILVYRANRKHKEETL